MSLSLPFPKLSVTKKTTKQEMGEYIEVLEAYATRLLNDTAAAAASKEPVVLNHVQMVVGPKTAGELTIALADVSTTKASLQSIQAILTERNGVIAELQNTINVLQGELNTLKGYSDKSATLETQLIEKLVPLKRRK
jgi:hypothetical protein